MRSGGMSFLQRALWFLSRAKMVPSAEPMAPGRYYTSALNIRSLTTIETLRRAAAFLRPYKWRAAANITFAILSLGFAFAFPQLTQYVTDDVLSEKKIEYLLPTVLALLGTFLFRDMFQVIRMLINNVFEQNVTYDMRCDVYSRLQKLPLSYFDNRASGDIITRILDDIAAVERLLIEGSEQGLVAILSIVIALIILFSKNPTLALVTLVPLPLLVIGWSLFTIAAHQRFRDQKRTSSALNTLLVDNLHGIRQIKVFNRQSYEGDRFSRSADDLRRSSLGILHLWAIYIPAMTFAAALGTVIAWGVGGSMVISGTMTVGELVGFIFYLSLFYPQIVNIHSLNNLLQSARAASERLLDILEATEETASQRRTDRFHEPVRGEVRYANVGFNYAAEHITLRDISFHARPGEMVALVGSTGAGKTTLVNLLPAFYEPTSGHISIDSCDIGRILLEDLRSKIAFVSQEVFLFNRTVRENIMYGNLDATEAEMHAAAHTANCHEFISQLPQGYDSDVGERGIKFSAGEKQRISLARALLKNAPILIFDEATASVDAEAERLIQDALDRMVSKRTMIIIAHRLSTIRNASQILVLRAGEIVERGNHDQLIRANGAYAELCRIQSVTASDNTFVGPSSEFR
jgi:ATP-binding cassette, subfamily B, bacterial